MQTIGDTLTLLRRQAGLKSAMKQPSGIRITEEQEILTMRHLLERFPESVEAIIQAAHALRKPFTNLNSTECRGLGTARQGGFARHERRVAQANIADSIDDFLLSI